MVPSPPALDLPAVLSFARYAVAAYAAAATILTTACIALHMITGLDRRVLNRSARHRRPLLVPLEAPPEAAEETA